MQKLFIQRIHAEAFTLGFVIGLYSIVIKRVL